MNFIEKTEMLPILVKHFLQSNKVRLEMEKSCFLYAIQEEQIQNISETIGLIFINEVSLELLPTLIEKNLILLNKKKAYGIAYEINYRIFNRFPEYFKKAPMLLSEWESLKSAPLISEDEAWQKVLEIEPWILEEKNEEKTEKLQKEEEIKRYQSQLTKITISVALKQYPEVGEQLITQNRINLAIFPESVRPSIKNWLTDYSYVVGLSNHDPIIRGNYLFKNKNTQKLSTPDREKLALILKSFEEKTLLTINTKTHQVAFAPMLEEKAENPSMQQTIISQKTTSPTFNSENDRLSNWRQNLPKKELLEKEPTELAPNNIRFSSPQTLSTEKVKLSYSSSPKPKNIYPQARPIQKNVVDLREK